MRYTLWAAGVAVALIIFPTSASATAELVTIGDTYKATVLINSYIVGDDYMLELAGSGTGSVISPDGLVLTTYRVAMPEDDFDGSVAPAAHQICFTPEVATRPECGYTARVLAADKVNDLALLKIAPLGQLISQTAFPYFEVGETDTVRLRDSAYTLSYPPGYRMKVTGTAGPITGNALVGGTKWITSEAFASNVSPGAPVYSATGRLLGMRTEVGPGDAISQNYAINVSSIMPWVNRNRGVTPRVGLFDQRLEALTVRQSLNDEVNFAKERQIQRSKTPPSGTYTYSNEVANYSIALPLDWQHKQADESVIIFDNEVPSTGSYVEISTLKRIGGIDTNAVDALVKYKLLAERALANSTIIKSEPVTLKGVSARYVQLSRNGTVEHRYYIPNGNYLILVRAFYGRADADKDTITKIINSLAVTRVSGAQRASEYSNESPAFSFRAGTSWMIQASNSKRVPVLATNQNGKAMFSVAVRRKAEGADRIAEASYPDYVLNNFSDATSTVRDPNLQVEMVASNPSASLGGELQSILSLEGRGVNRSTQEVLVRTMSYVVSTGDYRLVIEMDYFGSDEAGFNESRDTFKALLQTFSFSSKPRSATAARPEATKPAPVPAARSGSLTNRMKGKILLQVEGRGEAWYVRPDNGKRVYMKDGAVAYQMMRSLGTGISNADLEKIPVGVEARAADADQDSDGLADKLEGGLKTDPANPDTDGDGVNDGTEVLTNGTNPLGSGRLAYSSSLANMMLGKILLQVESRGEAWYIRPDDGKRYYMKDGDAAYQIMRYLSQGIKNSDLEKIEAGE